MLWLSMIALVAYFGLRGGLPQPDTQPATAKPAVTGPVMPGTPSAADADA